MKGGDNVTTTCTKGRLSGLGQHKRWPSLIMFTAACDFCDHIVIMNIIAMTNYSLNYYLVVVNVLMKLLVDYINVDVINQVLVSVKLVKIVVYDMVLPVCPAASSAVI